VRDLQEQAGVKRAQESAGVKSRPAETSVTVQRCSMRVIEGQIFMGMKVGRKRSDGYREFYWPFVKVIDGKPCNVTLIRELDNGRLDLRDRKTL